MEDEELYGIFLGIARANKHPDAASWADAAVRGSKGEEAWPEPEEPVPQGEDPAA